MVFRRKMKIGRTPKPPKMKISRLHEPILIEIFNKMKVKELVRMRKTCSFVDSLVENHEKRLASRPAVGVPFMIFTRDDSDELLFVSSVKADAEGTRICDDFDKRISGISFDTFVIYIKNNDRALLLRALEICERLQPICNKLSLPFCPIDFICSFTNCITFKNDLEVLIGFSLTVNFDAEKSLSDLSSLRKAPKCSKFSVSIHQCKITEGIFEKLKVFSHAWLTSNNEGFHELLWDIHSSKDKIMMKEISVSGTPLFEFEPESLPPMQNIHMPIGSNMIHEKIVRLMSLQSQFVLISGYCRRNITFIDKRAPALEELLWSIYAEPEDRERFKDDLDDEDEDDDDFFEYYEDKYNEHEEDEEVCPQERNRILKKNIRSIVSSIMQ